VRLPPDRRRKKRTDEPAEETPRPARQFESRRRRKCKLIGEGFKLKLLESATARYELNG